METIVQGDAFDLWEAWIDIEGTIGSHMLYVVGDVYTGTSKTVPVLKKKEMQGTIPSHLILEVMPGLNALQGRLTEVGYAEHIAHLNQYKQISICAGEKVIARINTIEVVV